MCWVNPINPLAHRVNPRASWECPQRPKLLHLGWATGSVCSVASRLHDASWGSIGPLCAAAVRIGRAALEERQAIAFWPETNSRWMEIGVI